MYKKWRILTKNAVNVWCLFAMKWTYLPKDIRLMISRLVWKSRREALYNIDKYGQLVSDVDEERTAKRLKC